MNTEPFPTITGAPCPKCGGLRQYFATQHGENDKLFEQLCCDQWNCDMKSAPSYDRDRMECIRSWNAVTFRLLAAGNNQQNSQDRSRPTSTAETHSNPLAVDRIDLFANNY
jgi:hypothetical protein